VLGQVKFQWKSTWGPKQISICICSGETQAEYCQISFSFKQASV